MDAIRIISLGFAVPPLHMTQREAFAAMGYEGKLAWRIWEATGIDTRHSWIHPARLRSMSWQELTEEYARGALALSVDAIHQALDGTPAERVDSLTFCSVSGYSCPSMSYPIAGEMGMRDDIVHTDHLGAGCQAAFPGLQRSYDYVKANGGVAVMVATEICSATYFPAPERDLEVTVANSIFADASAAAVVAESDDVRYPRVVDFESAFDRTLIGLLGYRWQDGRLRVVLDRRVPELVPPLIAKTVHRLLRRNGLTREDVGHWIMHPGGKKVLENLERELGLSHEDTRWSWETMRRFGNCSSATAGIIAKHLQRDHPVGWGVAVGMGAGTAVCAVLLQWE